MSETGARRPELLAPAGDWQAMRAAVANGADAVYFGLTRYSARQRAANFRREELPEVVRYLHGHNVRGYVTLNTLIFSDELADAADLAAAIASAGADAVIVQDLGLARLIRRLAPTLPIHASTQMTLTEPRGIEFVRRLGIERVILARELSVDEIRRIAHATPMLLEVFVHGALCMSYSGQCLASETLWGRSANRGLCGQACRLPYRLVVDGRERKLGDKAYLLSTKDLAAYDRVAELVGIGVAGFKIEGRLKNAQYVAITTQVYRTAIDAALAGRPLSLQPGQHADLVQSFSRGFTHGFLDGARHRDLVHGLSPKSRGVCIGKVTGKTPRGVLVAVEQAHAGDHAALKPGDGIVFDNGRPDEGEQGGRVFSVERRAAKKGPPTLLLTFGADDVDLAAVAVGGTVWKTDDPELRHELEKTYARDTVIRRAPLKVRLSAQIGRPLRVAVEDDAGNRAEVSWDQPLERAEKRPLTEDLVREQFGRLGDSPFELAGVEIVGERDERAPSAPVMAPKSVLNDLRRQAVRQLMEMREAKARRAIAEPEALGAIRREIVASAGMPRFPDAGGMPTPPLRGHVSREEESMPSERRAGHATRVDDGSPQELGALAEAAKESAPSVYALVRRPEQLDAVLRWTPRDGLPRPAMVYCDFPDVSDCKEAVARCRAAAMPVGLATLRIAKPGEEDLLAAIADARPDAVLVRHLAGLSFFREQAPELPLVGDFSLNTANEISAAILAEAGLARITSGLDLNAGQLAALLARFPASRCESIIHLHMPMMHMEHCVLAAHLAPQPPAAPGAADLLTHRAGSAPRPQEDARTRRVGRPAAHGSPACAGPPAAHEAQGCAGACRGHEISLRDRVGAEHPLIEDARCRGTLFSGHVQSAAPYVAEMRRWGARHFRVEFVNERATMIPRVLDLYARVLAALLEPEEAWQQLEQAYPAGVKRGTWDFR
jgi:putative protease